MNSFFDKVAAIAFISIILLGNFWFVFMITGESSPLWLATAFSAAVALALVGAVGVVLTRVIASLNNHES